MMRQISDYSPEEHSIIEKIAKKIAWKKFEDLTEASQETLLEDAADVFEYLRAKMPLYYIAKPRAN